MNKSIKMNKLTLGACYYPEHWDSSMWGDDLRRMREHGIEIIRVAEFAWSKFEPTEGVFTSSFFGDFLDLAFEYGIKVIIGTPSATPPAWLTQKYPEVLNADINGSLMRHGMRRHYNYNSSKYNELVSRVVEFMARSYCGHPAVIGWQIDNELNCECKNFYSESDHAAFRLYLKDKFGTLDAMNEAMGTVFWNQTYTEWDQVYLSRPTLHMGSTNPHLKLEEIRFISHSARRFCMMQCEIIRKYAPESQFITTNGLFGNIDNHAMTQESLDFMSYDCYPNFAFQDGATPGLPGALDDRYYSWNLSKTRSISPIFAIMELQSGAGGWTSRMHAPMPKPGQLRLWTYQSIAHGADFISFFRWRTCTVGTEIYWHGLNDYANRPNRRLAELMKTSNEIQKLADIAGTTYKAEIAMLADYSNEWDSEIDIWHNPLTQCSEAAWFAAAQHCHAPMDILYLREESSLSDLAKYKLLIYPHPLILTAKTAQILNDYVKQGGKVIFGARTGLKDEFGRCHMIPMPGYVADLCAVRVEDYTAIGPGDVPSTVDWEGTSIDAPEFNDILEPLPGSEVLGTFMTNYYAGKPALTLSKQGLGEAYYFGGAFSEHTAATFLKRLNMAEPYRNMLTLPEDMELALRCKDGREYFFILNYKPYSQQMTLHKPMMDHLADTVRTGTIDVPAYGVCILAVE